LQFKVLWRIPHGPVNANVSRNNCALQGRAGEVACMSKTLALVVLFIAQSDDRDCKLVRTLKTSEGAVTKLVFSRDGTKLITGGFGGARLWRTQSWKDDGRIATGRFLAVAPDGKTLATAVISKERGPAEFWDIELRKQLSSLQAPTAGLHHPQLVDADYSPDGTSIAISGAGVVTVWETGTWKNYATIRDGRYGRIAFSSDGKTLATVPCRRAPGHGDYDGKIHDAATGRLLHRLRGHADDVDCLAFTPDGKKLVTGSWDQTAKVWDASTGRELLTFDHSQKVFVVAVSGDGTLAATAGGAGEAGIAKVWELNSGQEKCSFKLQMVSHAPYPAPLSMAFSPDGELLAIGDSTGTVTLWSYRSN